MKSCDRPTVGQENTANLHLGLIHRQSAAAEEVLQMHGTPEDQPSGGRPDSVLARAFLRAVLTASTGPGPWTVGRAGSGAPFVLRPGKLTPPSVSLSHSGGWVACAACCSGAVGIDIEVRNGARNLSGIADLAFGPQEQAVARSGADSFYAIWVLREAIAKATGEGLSRLADQVDRVAAGPSQGERWSRFDGVDWWLMHQRPRPDLDLAIALRLDAPSRPQIKLQWWPA